MKKLLKYIVKGIIGSAQFSIKEEEEDDRLNYIIEAKPDYLGLIIGKNGKTIRAIRNLLRVRATLEQKVVSVSVIEKEETS